MEIHEIHGNPWISMKIDGNPWGSMKTHGDPWILMDFHAFPRILWVFMDSHEFPLDSREFRCMGCQLLLVAWPPPLVATKKNCAQTPKKNAVTIGNTAPVACRHKKKVAPPPTKKMQLLLVTRAPPRGATKK